MRKVNLMLTIVTWRCLVRRCPESDHLSGAVIQIGGGGKWVEIDPVGAGAPVDIRGIGIGSVQRDVAGDGGVHDCVGRDAGPGF
jgi:hypothetical protein